MKRKVVCQWAYLQMVSRKAKSRAVWVVSHVLLSVRNAGRLESSSGRERGMNRDGNTGQTPLGFIRGNV